MPTRTKVKKKSKKTNVGKKKKSVTNTELTFIDIEIARKHAMDMGEKFMLSKSEIRSKFHEHINEMQTSKTFRKEMREQYIPKTIRKKFFKGYLPKK